MTWKVSPTIPVEPKGVSLAPELLPVVFEPSTKAPSHYELSGPGLPKNVTPTGRLWSSIALRFGNFSGGIKDILAAVAGNPAPQKIASLFFNEKLGPLTELISRNPAAGCSVIKGANIASPYSEFIRIACGDMSALVPALDSIESLDKKDHRAATECAIAVASIRPREGRQLLRQLFTRVGNQERLRIIRTVAADARLDPNRTLGDLFVQLMARSTPEERREGIYPGIMQIISSETGQGAGKGMLRALFRGWLLEDDSARHYLKLLA